MNLRDRLQSLRPAPADAAKEPLASLKERVERLAAKAHAHSVVQRQVVSKQDVAAALEAIRVAPGVLCVEQSIPLDWQHGRLNYAALLDAPLALLCPDTPIDAEDLVFIDTETSGLAGGTGTLVFLLAVARLDGNRIRLAQWLLTAFAGEAAMLAAARDWLPAGAHLVSFNGKSFDVPLLATRYRMQGQADPFSALPHLDLLHLTRRAFGRRWEDCRLQTAEQHLLKFHREDDLPGSAMPRAWTEFMRNGDAHPMRAVLAHNRRDVLSLGPLSAALAQVYLDPDGDSCDAAAIARARLAASRPDEALRTLEGQQGFLDEAGLLLYAALLKRYGRRDEAALLWQRLAGVDCVDAIEQLAKHHEHRARDPHAALACIARLTELAGHERTARREARLTRKIARLGGRLF